MGLYVVFYDWRVVNFTIRSATREDNDMPTSVFAIGDSIGVMVGTVS